MEEVYNPSIPGRHFSNAIIIWKINSIPLLPALARKVSSEIIVLNGPVQTRWRLILEVSDEKDNVVLSLEMLPSTSAIGKVKVQWVSYIWDSNDDNKDVFERERERSYSFVPCSKLAIKMFRVSKLKAGLSTKSSDYLEIKCHMLVDFGYSPSFNERGTEGTKALMRDLGRLPKSFLYSDLPFEVRGVKLPLHEVGGVKLPLREVGGVKFPLHKAMLCHRLKKWAPSTNQSKSTARFNFSNVKAAEAVFTYLYTGDLKCILANPSVTVCEYMNRLPVPEFHNIYPKEIINLLDEAEVNEFSFSWTISDFKNFNNSIMSPVFHEERMKSYWQLDAVPIISVEGTKMTILSISIRAILVKSDKPLNVSLQFSVASDKLSKPLRRALGRVEEDLSEEENKSKQNTLEVAFFEKENELDQYMMKENSLPLHFKIRIATDNEFTSSAETVNFEASPFTIDKSYAMFTTAMSALKKSRDYSDAFFEVEGKTYKVHKFIVAARSPLFVEIFRKHATADTIKFPADQGKCIGQLISFLYLGSITESDAENLMTLWEIGEWSKIRSLKDECESRLSSLITNENVLQILLWADSKRRQDVIKASNLYVLKNNDKVMKGPSWDHFCTQAPNLSKSIMNSVSDMNFHIEQVQL